MKPSSRRRRFQTALCSTLLCVCGFALAEERVELTGNVYCRNDDDKVERPLARVRIYAKHRPDVVAESGIDNGKFRLTLPVSEVLDREIVLVYAEARSILGETQQRVSHDDVTVAAGKTTIQLAPKIFVVPSCQDLDTVGLRETVRLAVERMSHRAAVVHGELVRAHSAGNPETSACLDEALSRIGAHLRFAETHVPSFIDALGNDAVRARREVTAIKIADERVAELVEEADHCLERSVAHGSSQSSKYAPDPLISPSDLAAIPDGDSIHPPPWGRTRPGRAVVPDDDDWHFYPGASFETGYDSNFVQKNQGRPGTSVPAAWQFRPSLHLSIRRFDPESARRSPAPMRTGPVQSANVTLKGVLLTSTQTGGRSLGMYSDVAVAADFANRFGDGGPLGGVISAKYQRLVEPTIEPEHAFTFGTNAVGLGAQALMRPGSGRFEAGVGYRLALDYHDSVYQRGYDRVRHAAVVEERWLFLPETALLHQTEISSLVYVGDQRALNDSLQIRSRFGLVGVISDRFSMEALAGWAEGYYLRDHGLTPPFAGVVANAKLEWYFGPIAPNAYQRLALVRPSFALSYAHDYRDNLTSDYYRSDHATARLSLGFDERWVLDLSGGINRVTYPESRYFDPSTYSLAAYPGFGETRVDVGGAIEYRVLPQLRFTASYHYDRNLSDSSIPVDPNFPAVPEPLAYRRSRLYAGVIWAM